MSFMEVIEGAVPDGFSTADLTLFQMYAKNFGDNLREGNTARAVDDLKKIAERVFKDREPDRAVISVKDLFPGMAVEATARKIASDEPRLAPMISIPKPIPVPA